MTIRSYPADPRRVPRWDVATSVAITFEESGLPALTPADMAELKNVIERFVYQRPTDASARSPQ